jgi:hypothetical protein
MYFPRNWEFGSGLSKLRNLGGGGFEPPKPLGPPLNPGAVCVAPPEDEPVMLETCTGPLILNKLNKKCITLVSLY